MEETYIEKNLSFYLSGKMTFADQIRYAKYNTDRRDKLDDCYFAECLTYYIDSYTQYKDLYINKRVSSERISEFRIKIENNIIRGNYTSNEVLTAYAMLAVLDKSSIREVYSNFTYIALNIKD